MKTLQIKLNERAVLFQASVPKRALAPGRHRFWGSRLTEQRWNTDTLVFEAHPEVRALLPKDWFAEAELAVHERAILMRDGQAVAFLRPGTHRYWTLDESVELLRFDVRQPLPELSSEQWGLIPSTEYLHVQVEGYQQGLLMVNGNIVRQLEPGRYRFWRTPNNDVRVAAVDMRRRNLTISGQELMTRDKVSLRLSVTAEFVVRDPQQVTTELSDVEAVVYQAAQLALREYVGSVSLDTLLENRKELAEFLTADVSPKLERVGLTLLNVGVKDFVLPGEMKAILNRVIIAEKEAAANVILRREETAATRALANTAKLMQDQPVLLRLKELDALRDIAERIDDVRVVVGADGLKGLIPSQLLTGDDGN